ncbi:MAG: hypothetical protein WC619_01820 [Patescibacteria group bacterium]
MTGQEEKDFAESLIDDSIDETLFLTLLAVAKDNLEDERDWMYLKAVDSSQSISPGETYLTMKTLPTLFRKMLKVFVDNLEYWGIQFEDRLRYKDSSRKFYIDLANNQFAIIGTPAETKTIHQFYIKTTPELTLTTSPTFPTRFHKILGFKIAGYITAGVDADDIYARMSPEHKMAAEAMEESMRNWDTDLRLNAINYSAAPDLNNGGRVDSIDINE